MFLGAPRGLIGKSGEKPARSRHCISRNTDSKATWRQAGEGESVAVETASRSQETCRERRTTLPAEHRDEKEPPESDFSHRFVGFLAASPAGPLEVDAIEYGHYIRSSERITT